jgi:hypothetical protein
VSIKTASRAVTRKAGRSSRKPGQSLVSFPADRSVITPTEFQHQHLTARYGLRPGLAVIVAALLYQEPRR